MGCIGMEVASVAECCAQLPRTVGCVQELFFGQRTAAAQRRQIHRRVWVWVRRGVACFLGIGGGTSGTDVDDSVVMATVLELLFC